MASRRIREVEKRYVPQQESYRNLPSPTPTAETRKVTPDRLSPSPAAVRLQNLAKGFSALHGGLADYLSAEKSFEEANRAEAEVYGRLGYTYEEAQAAAQGHLDYGVRRGYEMGRALTDAAEVTIKYRAALEEAKHQLTPENFKSVAEVKRFADGLLDEALRGQGVDLRGSSQAYLEAAGRELAKLKLEGHVRAAEIFRSQYELANVDAYSDLVALEVENSMMPQASFSVAVSSDLGYQNIRDTISRLSKEASDTYHIDRGAANVLVVESMMNSLQQMAMEALNSQEGPQAYSSILTLESIGFGFMRALDLPDSAGGQRMRTMASNKELQRSIDSLGAFVTRLSSIADNLRGAQQKREANAITSQMAIDVFTESKDVVDVTDNLRELARGGLVDAEVVLEALENFHRVAASGALEPQGVSKATYMDYVLGTTRGELDMLQILEVAAIQRLPKDLVSDMIRGRTAYESSPAWEEELRRRTVSELGGFDPKATEAFIKRQQMTTEANRLLFQQIVSRREVAKEAIPVLEEYTDFLVKGSGRLLDYQELDELVSQGYEVYRAVEYKYAKVAGELEAKQQLFPYPLQGFQSELELNLLETQKKRTLYNQRKNSGIYQQLEAEDAKDLSTLRFLSQQKTTTTTNSKPANTKAWQLGGRLK